MPSIIGRAYALCAAIGIGALLAGLLCVAPARPGWSAPVRLLVLGDSLSAGYGLPHEESFEAQLAAALAGRGHPVQIIDGAVSGDTTAGGLARLDWVLGERPQAAIIELGGNDGLRGLPPSELEKNLAAILDKLAAHRIPTLLAGMYAPPNLGPDYERQFRAVFDTLGSRPGVIYEPFFMQDVALKPDLMQPDGLHPNAAGVRQEVNAILPFVEKLLDKVPAA